MLLCQKKGIFTKALQADSQRAKRECQRQLPFRLLESKDLLATARFLLVGLTLLRSQFIIVSDVTLINLARSFICSPRSIHFFVSSCPNVFGLLGYPGSANKSRLTNSEITQVSVDFSKKCAVWLRIHFRQRHHPVNLK